ncbi:hypothetical protein D3C71_2152900 [compost metagenome]
MRVKAGHVVSAITIMMLVVDTPSAATKAMATRKKGRARKASTMRRISALRKPRE